MSTLFAAIFAALLLGLLSLVAVTAAIASKREEPGEHEYLAQGYMQRWDEIGKVI